LRKEELIEKLWPDSFVGENSLAQNISTLRKALDDGSGIQCIETVPRIGYRFTAPVSRVEEGSEPIVPTGAGLLPATEQAGTRIDPSPEMSLAPVAVSPPTSAGARASRKLIAGVIALALILAVAIGFWLRNRTQPVVPTNTPLRVAVLPFRNLK